SQKKIGAGVKGFVAVLRRLGWEDKKPYDGGSIMGRGIVGGLVLLGLVVMIWFGRVTFLSGGGIVMPKLSASFEQRGANGPIVLTLTNTGDEPLRNIQVATERWKLDKRQAVCPRLEPGETKTIVLEPDLAGQHVYLFAARYPLPASFRVTEGAD